MNKQLIAQELLKVAKVLIGMNEARFWKWVDQIGWGTKTTDYKAIKKRLMLMFTPEEADEMSEIFKQLKGRLYKSITNWEDEDNEVGLGDDGFSDLLSHIIGLGKKEYDAVMADPMLAKKRADSGAFKESFSYAIPSAWDYNALKIEKFQKWAVKMMREYKEVLRAGAIEKGGRLKALDSKGKNIVKTTIMALDLMRQGDIDGFLKTEKKVLKALDLLWDGQIDWGIKNLYSDVRLRFA